MIRLRGVLHGVAALWFLVAMGALPLAAHAQQHRKPMPIITGTQQSSMDAPETNKDLEQYSHSVVVQKLGREMGVSTGDAARIFEDLNSGVLIAVILFFMARILPGKFRMRRETLARELKEARQATDEAQERMGRIESRLASLGDEVEELRRHAAEQSKGDEARIHAAMEEERRRIIRSAEAEIAAAQANAERGLKRFASDLAVDRAAERVRLTPEGDRALVDEFLQGLAGELGRRGKN